jgi:hypothetical protein
MAGAKSDADAASSVSRRANSRVPLQRVDEEFRLTAILRPVKNRPNTGNLQGSQFHFSVLADPSVRLMVRSDAPPSADIETHGTAAYARTSAVADVRTNRAGLAPAFALCARPRPGAILVLPFAITAKWQCGARTFSRSAAARDLVCAAGWGTADGAFGWMAVIRSEGASSRKSSD